MQSLNTLQQVAVWLLPVLFAITFHEVAHGWVANLLGDPTARMLGRLSLNPIKHIDPIGTVLVPITLLMLGGFIFGWAKPVPITRENLRHPKRDMAVVAAAGPGANLIMALFWGLMIKLSTVVGDTLPWAAMPLFYMGLAGVSINLVLMILNLLPIPPLDGGRIIAAFLPGPLEWKFSRIEPYGLIILVVLLAAGLLGRIMAPIFDITRTMIYFVVGL
jgi:Zn-dependent protease